MFILNFMLLASPGAVAIELELASPGAFAIDLKYCLQPNWLYAYISIDIDR